MNPRYPIYIVSKSRCENCMTARFLDSIRVPYRIVVEESQRLDYSEHFPDSRLLTLDPAYQDEYDTFDDLGASKSRGPGPARNYAWEHSIAEGAEYHWVMDDNIKLFARLHENERIPVGDGWIFNAMETFALRYSNVGMAGPQYWMFAPSRKRMPPFVTGTRIYSCNLIRNDVALRWRGRYNEDTDLSLRMLKAGWATVQFNAFLQHKTPTQKTAGGNTEDFYRHEGTLPKSQMLARMHPDVARVMWRYERWHHYVDYSRWLGMPLLRREDAPPEPDYNLRRVARP